MSSSYWNLYNRWRSVGEGVFPELQNRWILPALSWSELFLDVVLALKKKFPLKRNVLLVCQGHHIDDRIKSLLVKAGVSREQIFTTDELSLESWFKLIVEQKIFLLILPREHYFLGSETLESFWQSWANMVASSSSCVVLRYSFESGFEESDIMSVAPYGVELSYVGPVSVAILGSRLEIKPTWDIVPSVHDSWVSHFEDWSLLRKCKQELVPPSANLVLVSWGVGRHQHQKCIWRQVHSSQYSSQRDLSQLGLTPFLDFYSVFDYEELKKNWWSLPESEDVTRWWVQVFRGEN
jgi:hypothetical protein